jgi:hypothetical protein
MTRVVATAGIGVRNKGIESMTEPNDDVWYVRLIKIVDDNIMATMIIGFIVMAIVSDIRGCVVDSVAALAGKH